MTTRAPIQVKSAAPPLTVSAREAEGVPRDDVAELTCLAEQLSPSHIRGFCRAARRLLAEDEEVGT